MVEESRRSVAVELKPIEKTSLDVSNNETDKVSRFLVLFRDKEWAERDLDYSWVARLPAHPVYVNPSVRQLLSIFFFFFPF